VFPYELPGMPPEGAIEFKIELQLGTAPIAKAPYRMTPVEFAELKIQFQDRKTKALFTQVHHLGAVQHCLYRRRIKIFVCVWIIDS
jgi:hypothetical protein